MQLSHASRRKHSRLLRAAALSLTICCAVAALSQTVFAKTTYVITDGHQVTVHSTYATDPVDVLNEAGVELDHIDTFTTEPGNGVSEITVQRGQKLTVELFGQEIPAISYNETVGELLERMEVDLTGAEVSAPLKAVAAEGMYIRVYTTGLAVEIHAEEVSFETVYQKTNYLPAGTEVVLFEGKTGLKECKMKLTLVNGHEVERTLISETVITEPVSRVIAVGTGNGKPKTGAPIIGEGVIITPAGKVLKFDSVGVFEATAYMTMPPYTYDITATGTKVHKGSVAVDPTVIPYGTKMYIVSCDGKIVYGEGTAEDCGPAIKNDRIDLFYFTFAECSYFGRRDCYVYFLTD